MKIGKWHRSVHITLTVQLFHCSGISVMGENVITVKERTEGRWKEKVIILTICHTILMIFEEFGSRSANSPVLYIFPYSQQLSAWYYIDIVKRNSVLVAHGSERVKESFNSIGVPNAVSSLNRFGFSKHFFQWCVVFTDCILQICLYLEIEVDFKQTHFGTSYQQTRKTYQASWTLCRRLSLWPWLRKSLQKYMLEA